MRPLPGVILKHFTAIDVVSRWNVVGVHKCATSRTAAAFLDTLCQRMPFAVSAIQADGGSEFMACFEQACHGRGIRLFVLPPRSPKALLSLPKCSTPTSNVLSASPPRSSTN